MIKNKKREDISLEKEGGKSIPLENNEHLGSSNAFEETENPLSRDDDNISDEKLDELISE